MKQAKIIEFLPVEWVKEHVEENEYPLNELGAFTYTRTYSRWVPQFMRRERWHETVKRAIEYNMSLEYSHLMNIGIKPNMESMQKEARRLFENIYATKQFPSGRTLWLGNGNAKVNKDFVLGNYNCSFTNIEKWEDLAELFYLLMVGTGVGLKSTKEMALKMDPIRTDTKLLHSEYKPVKKEQRLEHTKTNILDNGFAKIYVGDSKEGWVKALSSYFDLLTKKEYEEIHSIKISYNSIRPHGERLKTFGGSASGPAPLREMFEGIDDVLKNNIDQHLEPITTNEKGYGHVRPIHILDIANLIGNNVVIGGVRRTAEIFLFDEDDTESLFAKYGMNGIWTEEQLKQHKKIGKMLTKLDIKPKWFDDITTNTEDKFKLQKEIFELENELKLNTTQDLENELVAKYKELEKVNNDYPRNNLNHRRMSNNSVAFVDKPSSEFLDIVFEIMQTEGEPGFVNLGEAARRVLATLGNDNPTRHEIHEKAYELGLNPCVEIILHSKNVCNLTTIDVSKFVSESGEFDLDGLLEAQRLSTRIGLRMTLATLELPEWNKIQHRDRLLGVSLTGWKDAMGKLNADQNFEDELKELLHDIAKNEADIYSKQLRVNAPMFVTAVKPEGTLSQVAGGVSSGLHWSHSPYFIRRIRINSSDPLVKVAKELDWTVSAEIGTNGKMTSQELRLPEQIEAATTLVIDFPVKSTAKETKDDITIDDQFDNYFSFQDLYTDMNTSNTMTVKPGEWKQAQKRVYDGWDNFVGVSFLSHDGGTYQLAPYEAITKEEYEELKESMKPFNDKLLMKYEFGETEADLEGVEDPDCVGGVCPIR